MAPTQPHRHALLPLLWLTVLLGVARAALEHGASGLATATRPNILVVLTDDQDRSLGSLNYMSGVKTHLMNEGVTYQRHYCTIALCCPSRVNLWTGRAAHNTNVTDLAPPWGGYPKFIAQGLDATWLPTLLQNAGYNTYYTGKLMNAHTITNYNKPFARGFTGHDYLLEPGTYQYNNATYQRNNDPPRSYPGQYTTTLLLNKSMAFLDEAAESNAPFFMVIAPVAPHTSLQWNAHQGAGPIPAKKYVSTFNDLKVPRTPDFNPDVPSGANWIRSLPQLNQSQIDYGDEWYRNRTRALQSVDELVNATIAKLESMNVLNNTYVVYSSDNGYSISSRRFGPMKRLPYEANINVPLIIRGPGIAAGVTSNFVTTHTDLMPTMLKWAGVKAPANLDGLPIPTNGKQPDPSVSQNWEHVQVEHWGSARDEGKYEVHYTPINNTYKALRLIGPGYNLYYAVWCDGSHELYDMTKDKAQMNNLYGSTNTTILNAGSATLETRLDALLLVLKSCVASTCTDPWTALHPDGDVRTLQDALGGSFDQFYTGQNKVDYQACKEGYLPQYEMPLQFHRFGSNASDSEVQVIQGREPTWDEVAMWDEWIMFM